jgi:tetratricopeptide (TPR) repeat protein
MPIALVLLLALQTSSSAGGEILWSGCSDEEVRAVNLSARRMAQGDDAVERDAVARGIRGPIDRCGAVKLSRAALVGWVEARKLAPAGGDKQLLGPAMRAIEELEALKTGPLAIDAEYAQVAIRAAIAAAQDERPELELLLTHARDLTERLAARGRRATWPRPYNLLAGELWLEVDRYDEARSAFERAVRAEESAIALVGLGRTLARLNRHDEACQAFRRVRNAAPSLMDETRSFLATCQ